MWTGVEQSVALRNMFQRSLFSIVLLYEHGTERGTSEQSKDSTRLTLAVVSAAYCTVGDIHTCNWPSLVYEAPVISAFLVLF